MKKRINPIVGRLCLIVGFCLLAGAVAVPIFWQWSIRSAEQKAADYVQTIRTLIPQPQSAVPEERRDNAMPILSVDGTDFMGILEIPSYDSALPVCAAWGKVTKYPCCLDGSVYDRTLQIGGTTQKGQYDFYRELSVGDAVFFTDMEGNCFSYDVTDIRYEKHTDQETLRQKDAALTLFVKNVHASEYLIIFCDVLH